MLHRSELAPEPFQTHCEIIRYSYTGRLRCPIKRPKAAAPELFERQNCLGRRIKYCFEFKVYIKRCLSLFAQFLIPMGLSPWSRSSECRCNHAARFTSKADKKKPVATSY